MAQANLQTLAAQFLDVDPSLLSPESAGPIAQSATTQASNAKLSSEDVALTKEGGAGAEAGLRSGIALRRGENLKRFLDEKVGPANYRFSDDGQLVLRNSEGREYLADEIGITGEDLVDFLDMGAPTLGAIGAAAAAPTSAGVIGLAAISALGAAGAGSAVDAITTAGSPGNWERAKEIFSERGPEAVLDFLFGIAGGKLTRMTSRELPPPSAVDPNADIPASAVVEARDRLQDQAGEKIPLTLAEATGSPAAARAQSIGSKLPGSAGKFKDIRERQDAALSKVQQGITTDTANASKDAVRVLNDQADDLTKQKNALVSEADSLLQAELANVSTLLGKEGSALTAKGSGMIRRQAAIRARQQFRDASTTLYKAAEKLGLNDVEVTSTAPLKALVRRIEAKLPQTAKTSQTTKTRTPVEGTTRGKIFREEVTTQESGGDVLNRLIPEEVRGLLGQLKAIEANPTYAQIKGLRTVINDAIDAGAAIPGAGQGFLKQISGTLTQMLVAAERSIKDPALRRALTTANNHYMQNVDQFQRAGITDSFVPSTEPGFVEDVAFAKRLLRQENIDELKAAMGFMNDREKLGFTRGIWNDMLESSRSTLSGGKLSVDSVIDQIDAMPSATRRMLFGDALEPIQKTLRLMQKTGTKELDLADVADLDGAAVEKLRGAARAEAKRVREYKTGVVGKFLNNDVGYAELNPDEFAGYLLRHGDLQETQAVIKKLGTDSAEAKNLRKAMVKEILHASQRGASQEEVILDLVQAGQPIVGGRELLKTLTTIGGQNSREKLNQILGKETMQTLQDIGVFRAGQQRLKDVGSAGGLIAGSIFAQLASGVYGRALRISAVYKGLSVLLTNEGALRLLRTRPKQGARINIQTALATTFNDLQKELADEPGAYEAWKEMLLGLEGADPQVQGESPTDLQRAAEQFIME